MHSNNDKKGKSRTKTIEIEESMNRHQGVVMELLRSANFDKSLDPNEWDYSSWISDNACFNLMSKIVYIIIFSTNSLSS